MKITYGQADITAALRAYITSEGISLEGKSLDIKFTMKKGAAGVAADVTIEKAPTLPDLSEPVKPVLSVVASSPATVVAAEAVETKTADPEPVYDERTSHVAEMIQATGTDDAAPATPAVKTTSLFN